MIWPCLKSKTVLENPRIDNTSDSTDYLDITRVHSAPTYIHLRPATLTFTLVNQCWAPLRRLVIFVLVLCMLGRAGVAIAINITIGCVLLHLGCTWHSGHLHNKATTFSSALFAC